MTTRSLREARFLETTVQRAWRPPQCPRCDGRMGPDLSVLTTPVYQCGPCGIREAVRTRTTIETLLEH